MAKLKPGAVIIDLVDGSIHGDLDHCPREDLLESAQALLSLLPQAGRKGLWGLGKAFDADCYLLTADRRYRLPEGLHLEADIHRGTGGLPRQDRPFRLVVVHSDRETHWRYDWYSRLVGSVQGGRVTPDTEGKPDHYRPPPPPSAPTPQPRRQKAQGVQEEGAVQRSLF